MLTCLHRLSFVSLTLSAVGLASCSFDRGLPEGTFGPATVFEGCFEVNRIQLILEKPKLAEQLLTGIIRFRPVDIDLNSSDFAVEGEAKSPQLAILQGSGAGSSGDPVEIIVLRSAVDTVTVQIGDNAPIGPLTRCV